MTHRGHYLHADLMIEKPNEGDDCPHCGRKNAIIIDPENRMMHCLVCSVWWSHE